jgi:cysteine desulfuration protein SufE
MQCAQRQARLVADFSLIEDYHERLAAIVSRGTKAPSVPESDRVEALRVVGCTSRVWLALDASDGVCRWRVAADSPLVLGLAALVADCVEGCPVSEVRAFEPSILEQLGVWDRLSPSRQQGLASFAAQLRALAAAAPGHAL